MDGFLENKNNIKMRKMNSEFDDTSLEESLGATTLGS